MEADPCRIYVLYPWLHVVQYVHYSNRDIKRPHLLISMSRFHRRQITRRSRTKPRAMMERIHDSHYQINEAKISSSGRHRNDAAEVGLIVVAPSTTSHHTERAKAISRSHSEVEHDIINCGLGWERVSEGGVGWGGLGISQSDYFPFTTVLLMVNINDLIAWGMLRPPQRPLKVYNSQTAGMIRTSITMRDKALRATRDIE